MFFFGSVRTLSRCKGKEETDGRGDGADSHQVASHPNPKLPPLSGRKSPPWMAQEGQGGLQPGRILLHYGGAGTLRIAADADAYSCPHRAHRAQSTLRARPRSTQSTARQSRARGRLAQHGSLPGWQAAAVAHARAKTLISRPLGSRLTGTAEKALLAPCRSTGSAYAAGATPRLGGRGKGGRCLTFHMGATAGAAPQDAAGSSPGERRNRRICCSVCARSATVS